MGRKLEGKIAKNPAVKDTAIQIKLTPKQMQAFNYLTDMNNGVSEVLYGGG